MTDIKAARTNEIITSSPPNTLPFEEIQFELNLDKTRDYKNLLELIDTLSLEQYLELRKIDSFRNLMSQLHPRTENTLDIKRASTDEYTLTSATLPDIATPLDQLFFGNSLDKLITRLINASKSLSDASVVGERLVDILNLSQHELKKLPGVGSKYVDLWFKLKEIYSPSQKNTTQLTTDHKPDAGYDSALNELKLNYLTLTSSEKKALTKLELNGHSITPRDLISLNINHITSIEGFGQTYGKTLTELKTKLNTELSQLANKTHLAQEKNLLIPIFLKCESVDELSNILLEDIDNFLDNIDEKMQDIFQCRWGFVEAEITLEELGTRYDVTRERIRQQENSINNELLKSLRLQPTAIWKLLQHEIDLNLPEKMKSLSSCFDNERNFYKFISFASGDKDLSGLLKPTTNPNILKNFFLNNGPQCTQQQAMDYLTAVEKIDHDLISNTLFYLESKKTISLNKDIAQPIGLKKHEAIACVLSEHPNGLPWLDAAKITNIKKISRYPISETTLDNSAFFDSSLIYLCGKGLYKHTKFINFSETNIKLILQEIIDSFEKFKRTTIHLSEAYNNSLNLKENNYYTTRYIVKMLGSDRGIYFSGKSQSDTISLEEDFQSVTQKEVILQAMNESGKALTKSEIAALLKSNSLDHASLYIDQLMYDMKIVQVDRMLYTTPEIAYQSIDLPTYTNAIRTILAEEGRPVDPSYIQLKLNNLLGQSYSKYFYASVARFAADQFGWERKMNLFSLSDIPYSSLTNAMSIHCRPDWSNNKNYKEIINHISITEDAASATLNNWRASLARAAQK